MRKEFEIQGCIEVPPEVTEDEFWNAFIEFVESKGWPFGGGIQEIQDGYYILADGTRGAYVLDECQVCITKSEFLCAHVCVHSAHG